MIGFNIDFGLFDMYNEKRAGGFQLHHTGQILKLARKNMQSNTTITRKSTFNVLMIIGSKNLYTTKNMAKAVMARDTISLNSNNKLIVSPLFLSYFSVGRRISPPAHWYTAWVTHIGKPKSPLLSFRDSSEPGYLRWIEMRSFANNDYPPALCELNNLLLFFLAQVFRTVGKDLPPVNFPPLHAGFDKNLFD